MEQVAGVFLKGIFAFVILVCGVLIAVAGAGMDSMAGLISPGILIPLALIGWILLRRPKWTEANSVQKIQPSVPLITVGDRLKGIGALIEVRSSGLAVTRKGTSSFFIHGLKGEKLFPFKSITAVQLKEPTRKMSGYIQFSLLGGIESSRGIWDASQDENTVLFGLEQLPEFLGLRNLVEEWLSKSCETNGRPTQTRAQDLATLAALRDKGHLTDDEFRQEKAKILVG